MKSKSRFIKSVVETARKSEGDLPWSRGARRAAMIARRTTEQDVKRSNRLA